MAKITLRAPGTPSLPEVVAGARSHTPVSTDISAAGGRLFPAGYSYPRKIGLCGAEAPRRKAGSACSSLYSASYREDCQTKQHGSKETEHNVDDLAARGEGFIGRRTQ